MASAGVASMPSSCATLIEWLAVSVARAAGSTVVMVLTVVAPMRAAARYNAGRRPMDGGRRRRSHERQPSAGTPATAAGASTTTSAGASAGSATAVTASATGADRL